MKVPTSLQDVFCHFGNFVDLPSDREISHKRRLQLSVLPLQDIVKLQQCYARYWFYWFPFILVHIFYRFFFCLSIFHCLRIFLGCSIIFLHFPLRLNLLRGDLCQGSKLIGHFHLFRVLPRALELLSMPSAPASSQMVWLAGANEWCWTILALGCWERGQMSSTRLSSTARYSKICQWTGLKYFIHFVSFC